VSGGKRERTTDVKIRDVEADGNGALKVIDTSGGAITGNVTVIFGNNTWQVDANGRGPVEQVPKQGWTTLDTLNASFGSAESSKSTYSAWQDTTLYKHFTLGGYLTKGGTPTDILFKVYFNTNNSGVGNPQHYQDGYWGDVRVEDVFVGSGNSIALDGECRPPYMQVFVTMSGVNGTTFTLSDMTLYLSA
jgi:hypothetical protein